jgi:hypothetical protein
VSPCTTSKAPSPRGICTFSTSHSTRRCRFPAFVGPSGAGVGPSTPEEEHEEDCDEEASSLAWRGKGRGAVRRL